MEQAEREADARNAEGAGAMDVEEEEDNPETAIVLAEDKKYYPSAEEVYGEGTETLVMDEDAQPLEEPIIAPLKTKRVEVRDANAPVMRVSEEYLLGMLSNPNLTRNVAVCGHLHHGKTSFMDMVVEQTHALSTEGRDPERQMRYMDNRQDEQDREVSIKATPLTVAMPASSGKHLLFNFMDTPGHVNFSDEVTASLRLADAVLLVVDAVEGVMCVTERVIKHAARDRLPIVVFVNKMDRLILELKLPPADASKISTSWRRSTRSSKPHAAAARTARSLTGQGRCTSGPRLRLVLHAGELREALRRAPKGGDGHEEVRQRLWGLVHADARARKPPGGGDRSVPCSSSSSPCTRCTRRRWASTPRPSRPCSQSSRWRSSPRSTR